MAKYKSDINLFDCIFKDKTKKAINLEKEIKKSILVFAGVAVVVIVVGGAGVLAQKGMLEYTKSRSANLRETFDFDAISAKKAECEKLTADNQKIRAELANFEASPQFKTELLGYIAAAQPEDVLISSIGYSGSTISLSCTGSEQLTGAKFANRLREETDVFSDVSYAGTSGSGNSWSFSIDVTIVDKQAEEAETPEEATDESAEETTSGEA
jgi:cell division protein FtsB